MRNYTVSLRSDKTNQNNLSMQLNTKLLRDDSNMVMKPIDIGYIISISVSPDKRSADVLFNTRDVVKVDVESIKPWKWENEIHIYQTGENCVNIRGCRKYNHYMVTESDYCVIQIGNLSVFVNTDKRSFYMDGKNNLGRFSGSEIREGVYDTSVHEDGRNLVIGLSDYQSDLLSIEETDSIPES